MRPPGARIDRVACLLLVGTFSWLNYWEYSWAGHGVAIQAWHDMVIACSLSAPDQYRVLVPHLADILMRATGWAARHAYGLIDAVALAATAGILVLRTPREDRVLTLALCAYALAWCLTWERKPETLSAAAFAGLTALCMQRGTARHAVAATAAGLVAAFVRADLALSLAVALVALGYLRRQGAWWGAGAVVAIGAVAVQAALSFSWFRHAAYATSVIQLAGNLSPQRWLVFFLFATPVLWTVTRIARGGARLQPVAAALAAAFVAHAALVLLLGSLGEPRILLPLALTLLPFTARFVRAADGEPPARVPQ